MTYDMDSIDELIEKGENFIYAEQSNLSEIEYKNIKKGFFNTIILKQINIDEWPEVEFYYSSKASDRESDYLLNVDGWPIVHKRVKETLEKEGIKGIKYFAVKLIDVVTQKVNSNYFLMDIENFIDAFDMNKSEYKYNEKYNMYTFVPSKTYLNYRNCEGYDIFRCSKSPAAIYVSDKFYNLIHVNKFTGFYFYKVN